LSLIALFGFNGGGMLQQRQPQLSAAAVLKFTKIIFSAGQRANRVRLTQCQNIFIKNDQ
jgi:hypothetical protein